jgi:hypothetical protein
MDKRTTDILIRRGVKKGKVTVFYHAKPKPRAAAESEPDQEFEPMSAKEVLEGVLKSGVKDLKDVLIFTRDTNDVVGLISNLYGPAENLLFLKQVELQIIQAEKENDEDGGPPPRFA